MRDLLCTALSNASHVSLIQNAAVGARAGWCIVDIYG